MLDNEFNKLWNEVMDEAMKKLDEIPDEELEELTEDE